MLLLLRAVLVLGLATMLHTTRKGQVISVKLGRGTRGKSKTVQLVMDLSVPPHNTRMPDSSIANMSLSPWTYRESFVASRLPQTISQAQCLTSGCLSLQGGGEDASLEAKPIYYQVLVLHRISRKSQNNQGGKKKRRRYDIKLGREIITVGCTCVRPSVIPQS